MSPSNRSNYSHPKNRACHTDNGWPMLWKYNENHDCGVITAFREFENYCDAENGSVAVSRYSRKDNTKRNKSLLAKLKTKGYGVIRLRGKYPADGNGLEEEGYFVFDEKDTGDLTKDLISLGKEFEQGSVLIAPKGAIGNQGIKAYLYGTNSGHKSWLGMDKTQVFNDGTLEYDSFVYTSKVNGRPFWFERPMGVVHYPSTGFGVWMMHLAAKKHWSQLDHDCERAYE